MAAAVTAAATTADVEVRDGGLWRWVTDSGMVVVVVAADGEGREGGGGWLVVE